MSSSDIGIAAERLQDVIDAACAYVDEYQTLLQILHNVEGLGPQNEVRLRLEQAVRRWRRIPDQAAVVEKILAAQVDTPTLPC